MKNKKYLIVIVGLILVVGIVCYMFGKQNSMSNKWYADTSNLEKENGQKTIDETSSPKEEVEATESTAETDLEYLKKQISNIQNLDNFEEKLPDYITSSFYKFVLIPDGMGVYFIYNNDLYFSVLNKKEVYKIDNLDGNPIKIVNGFYSSDESVPAIGVLTNKNKAYLTSFNSNEDFDLEKAVKSLINFKEIESDSPILDIVFMQNYEVYKSEEAYAGSAIPFVYVGYQWKIVNKEDNYYRTGNWLKDIK